MNDSYLIEDATKVYSPALLFYKQRIESNIARMVEIAGSPQRLRPHVKTHKTREIVHLELATGISKHKCATLAEAEMLADVGVRDIFLAYNIVGPNCQRLAELCRRFPDCRFAVTADHPAAVRTLSEVLARAGQNVQLVLDLDVGQHRTGIAPGDEAKRLYELIARLPAVEPGGFHVYDGHNHQHDPGERAAAVQRLLEPVLELRTRVEKQGIRVPRLVLGGTPTFPLYARLGLPDAELAPGTCVLHDHGYGSAFADLAGFVPAALLLTRVISRPTATRVTLDLGYKAVASDPPAGKRCVLLNVPDYTPVLQNEEHFVVETPAAERFAPGDIVYAVPTHICPTCAMHQQAYVVENRRVVDRWPIVARDRILSV